MPAEKVFLLLEMNTGMMDGWYLQRDVAKEVLERFKLKHPAECWIMLEENQAQNGYVSDRMFHVNYRIRGNG